MVDRLLTAAGIPGRGSRFTKPPTGIYAVWRDNVDADGPDNMAPFLFKHSVTVEIYAPKKEPAALAAFETQMGLAGLHWTKMDWVWIKSEQLYQTIYEFEYTQKGGPN